LTIDVQVVLAQREPAAWAKYVWGQEQVYLEYGVEQVCSPALPGASQHLILASPSDGSGEVIGGVRLHAAYRAADFPAVDDLGSVDGAAADVLTSKLEDRLGDGVVEIKGLWVRRENRGSGLARTLLSISSAVSVLLGVRWILAFASPHSSQLSRDLGFAPDEDIPRVLFPDKRYLSQVCWQDCRSPRSAAAGDKFQMARYERLLRKQMVMPVPRGIVEVPEPSAIPTQEY